MSSKRQSKVNKPIGVPIIIISASVVLVSTFLLSKLLPQDSFLRSGITSGDFLSYCGTVFFGVAVYYQSIVYRRADDLKHSRELEADAPRFFLSKDASCNVLLYANNLSSALLCDGCLRTIVRNNEGKEHHYDIEFDLQSVPISTIKCFAITNAHVSFQTDKTIVRYKKEGDSFNDSVALSHNTPDIVKCVITCGGQGYDDLLSNKFLIVNVSMKIQYTYNQNDYSQMIRYTAISNNQEDKLRIPIITSNTTIDAPILMNC